MIRTKTRMRICTALLVLNVLIIWGSSSLPGSVSGAISGWVRDLIANLFGGGAESSDAGHGLLRKVGHFVEFSCLGVGFSWLFSMLKKPVALTLLCGFSVACVDETIQRFIPDRGPSFKDVLLDTAGVAFGLVLILVGCAIYKGKQNKLLEENKQ